MAVLMKCGHAANARDEKGNPCCVICFGMPGWNEVDSNPPNLEGRLARCGCGRTVPSNLNLPFFEHRPDKATDSYYCGCKGWD